MHMRLRVRRVVCAAATINKIKRAQKFKNIPKIKNRKRLQPAASDLSKATTTELVKFVFKSVFENQIENFGSTNVVLDKLKPCGVCEKCQLHDCGICVNCTKKTKFGGGGKHKRPIICKEKRCLKFIGPDFDDYFDLENDSSDAKSSMRKKFSGTSPSFANSEGRVFYKFIKFGNIVIKPDDYVLVNPDYKGELLVIAQIQYIYSYESDENLPMFHSRLLSRGSKTILGECADPCELFITDTCGDYFYYQFVRKLDVTFRKSFRNWNKSGNSEVLPVENEEDGLSYFFSRKYEQKSGTFTHFSQEPIVGRKSSDSCCACANRAKVRTFNTPELKVSKNQQNVIEWKGDKYRTGTCIFLDPKTYNLNVLQSDMTDESDEELADDEIHTELYRKKFTIQKKPEVPDPFCVGRIEKISKIVTGKTPKSQKTKIQITARLFYRPENTMDGKFLRFYKNLNAVYWSNIVVQVPFENICGICHLRYFTSEERAEIWGVEGPDRFYFTEHYRAETNDYAQVPKEATRIGNDLKSDELPPKWPKIRTKLKCMDLFSGCGGLSEGFHQSGLSETRWAVEKDQAAAEAFRLNNPNCKVLTGDCNKLLKNVIAGDAKSLGFPEKGEVDLLVAGSPCQGYSSLNRFNTGDASLLSNALIASCLSYCDYYRPNYFVLENVRNIVASKFTIIIKLVIKCLLLMDYQLTLGVLQAGHYGVPQSRRRFILIAAAPGFNLPKLPDPITCFNSTGGDNLLQIKIDGVVYENDFRWVKSAPLRSITIRDAISDLPLEVPETNVKVQYVNPPDSTFEKTVRAKDTNEVDDHWCRKLQEIDKLRISLIPKRPGADWRDLPNIGGTLKSGRKYAKIQYTYCTKKQDPGQRPRGVCECAIGGPCIAPKSDVITVIPWFLPHTGDRHNHFAGVYGRLDWEGCFGTSLTNPNPMTKQGKVIHPEADRIISVREAARSQGFPDKYKFYGNISDRYKQIGNAVPPPLAFAIGQEIKAAVAKS